MKIGYSALTASRFWTADHVRGEFGALSLTHMSIVYTFIIPSCFITPSFSEGRTLTNLEN